MKKMLIITLWAPIVFAACGIEDLPPPAQQPVVPSLHEKASQQPVKPEAVKYVYHGDTRRDPFIALNGAGAATSSSTEEVVVPNISALVLKGIIDDGKSVTALIGGGGITYMLKDHRLYDNRQRLVGGVSGTIRRDSVVLVGADRIAKELKLRER